MTGKSCSSPENQFPLFLVPARAANATAECTDYDRPKKMNALSRDIYRLKAKHPAFVRLVPNEVES
jgi:hypothetical protein